jgi:uracil-DNA glycosylase
LIDPGLIIPVGRLAIGIFFPGPVSLEDLIGEATMVNGRWVAPLPHPSGASRWHQGEENRQRIRRAVLRIEQVWEMLSAPA